MSIFKAPLRPDEVFTPRSHDLNQKTYAERPALETRLRRALNSFKYVILHGESGNGKTWLYKRVLQESGVNYQIVNLAKMHNEGSLNAVLALKLGELGASIATGEKKEVEGGIKPGGIGVNYKDTVEYKSMPLGVLEQLANDMAMRSGQKPTVLVLDNFEQVVDNDSFVRQIASLIISADDEFIARTKLKIMIVGTPTNIKQMISKVSNATTISNRFTEIPEVARLELGEARHIMYRGFEQFLKLTFIVDKNQLYKSISHKTDRIAQHVQELCLKIAYNAVENKGIVTDKVVAESEQEWLEETLSADMAVVDTLMNAQETKVGRKNQVMYCLGLIESEDFKQGDVERIVRSTFSVSKDINLNIPQILAGFAQSENPLIRKAAPKGGKYRFCTPKTKMVIRTNLRLDKDNKVVRTA
jgi:hypothetical protein